eukprot:TRINITY_DN78691_c0_g1_i1.p1 TRINITY_DN78691_c0_g1~~TRINITY_DN78691_c0_g1_i1.p1  ORF type:complete len:552 (+),score=78.37 TRINITY_DN78691_c0_g1_i1:41-1696(+)
MSCKLLILICLSILALPVLSAQPHAKLKAILLLGSAEESIQGSGAASLDAHGVWKALPAVDSIFVPFGEDASNRGRAIMRAEAPAPNSHSEASNMINESFVTSSTSLVHRVKNGCMPPLSSPVFVFAFHHTSPGIASLFEGIQPSAAKLKEPGWAEGIWLLMLLASLALLGLIAGHMDSRMKVQHSEPTLQPECGRPFWTYCCGACIASMCLINFLLAWLAMAAVNFNIETKQLASSRRLQSEGIVVQKIDDSGFRSFQAGGVVVLSVLSGCLSIIRWRFHGQVKVSNALLSQFAMRGVSFAVSISMILEILGQKLLHLKALSSKKGHASLGGGLWLGVLAGASEEFAKVVVVIWGTWHSREALQSSRSSVCGGCRALIQSQRALMLTGLSVGYAFMTIENAGYILAMVSAPVISYRSADVAENVSAAVVFHIEFLLIITIRVGLNLHPWLAGITSARVARVTFDRQTSAVPSLKELVLALMPSVLAHSAYDFILVALPDSMAIFAPPLFFGWAYHKFAAEWSSFDQSVGTLRGNQEYTGNETSSVNAGQS